MSNELERLEAALSIEPDGTWSSPDGDAAARCIPQMAEVSKSAFESEAAIVALCRALRQCENLTKHLAQVPGMELRETERRVAAIVKAALMQASLLDAEDANAALRVAIREHLGEP
jgi:hypothetical protein